MKNKFISRLLTFYMLLLFLCLFLASCGKISVGKNAISNDTPTATATSTAAATAPATATATLAIANSQATGLGNDYAFVRNNQVWVALHGAAPVQATHFTAQATDSNGYHWSQLHWFAQDRYLAFTVEISARGGNSCLPLPVMGQLFVIDTSSMQTTAVTPRGTMASQQVPVDGLWSTLTAQDDTHLLAWYGDQGIYSYDFTTQNVSLAIPRKNLAAMLGFQVTSMVERNGQLYYFSFTPPDAAEISHFMIYSLPLSGGSTASTKVFDAGTGTVCSSKLQNDGPIRNLGWDISPDGTHLVTLAIDNSNPTQPRGKVEIVNLQDGTTTPIFTQVPAEEGLRYGNLTLSWSPDGHNILLIGTDTFYTSSIDNPAVMQTYNVKNQENVFWQAHRTTFTADDPHSRTINIYTVGKPDGQILLTNGADFAGGNQ